MDQVNAIENTLKEIMAKIDEITELLQKEDSTKTIKPSAKASNLPKSSKMLINRAMERIDGKE